MKILPLIAVAALAVAGCGKKADVAPPAPTDIGGIPEFTNSNPQVVLRALNDMVMGYQQSNPDKPMTTLEDLVTGGFINKLPEPPPGMKFKYNPQTSTVILTR